MVGQFFRALSLTLSAAVLMSLVLALTLIPLLVALGLLAAASTRREERPSRLRSGRYARALGASVHRPWLAVVAALVLAVAGYLLYRGVPAASSPAWTRAASSSTT